jgi:hypothetical protein
MDGCFGWRRKQGQLIETGMFSNTDLLLRAFMAFWNPMVGNLGIKGMENVL